MSIDLKKGQKVDLTKGRAGLTKVIAGLGWDAAKTGAANFDCDASAVLLCGEPPKMTALSDIIYYGHLRHNSGAVIHNGDNLTGDGDGDDEQITVDFTAIPSQYTKVVFVVNVFEAKERSQHFGMLKNAYIRLVDAQTQEEICRYNLGESYDGMTGLVFGEIYRRESDWKFNAIGMATTDDNVLDLSKRFK